MNHKNMHLIYKLAFKVIFFATIMILIGIIEPAILPVVNNDMYLTQMENSDAYYTALATYQRLKPIFTIAKIVVACLFVGLVSIDIQALYRNLTKPNPEET